MTVMNVTGNVSTQGGSAVTCYGCGHNGNQWTNRQFGFEDGLHCTTCHRDGHRACAACGKCLLGEPVLWPFEEADGTVSTRIISRHRVRWDRFYCNSTCRVKALHDRRREEFARAAWEAEHPEEAAKARAAQDEARQAIQRIQDLMTPPKRQERLRRIRSLKDGADRCAECDRPFGQGDVVYRRRGGLSKRRGFCESVLPYCAEHTCGQLQGHHNRDLAGTERVFQFCGCFDNEHGRLAWTDPAPCAGCGRLVRYHKTVKPQRFVRNWCYSDKPGDSYRERVKIFCSDGCKRRVFRVEAKAKRLAARGDGPHSCPVCRYSFTSKRSDAQYCCAACRQRAYRRRHTARSAPAAPKEHGLS